MNKRHLVVLAFVALSGLVAIFWSQSLHEPSDVDIALIPGLLESINDVSQVRISSAEATVTLDRNDTGWGVEEISSYPADSSKLRALLLALGRAQKLEQKTSRPELYAQLGVADPGSADGAALQIEIDGVETPAALLVGITSPGRGDSTYVRFAGAPESWLVDQVLDIDRAPIDWVNRLVIDLAPDTVRSISIVDASGERFSISREATGTEYKLDGDTPEGKQLNQRTASRFVGELAGFNFDDARNTAEDLSDADGFVVTAETFGGARIAATLSKSDDKHFMVLAAEAVAGATPDPDAAAMIDAVTRRDGWRFEIPAFKYNQFDTTRDDLLEDAP